MNVEIVEATHKPEELVCTAARNDYRSEGVLSYTFDDIISGTSGDPDHLFSVAEDAGYEVLIDDDIPDHADNPITRETREDGEKVTHRYWVPHPAVMSKARKLSLIDHLIDHGHWGPFEHPQATLALEGVTRVLMAQITRHRHFTFDIMSLRYVGLDEELDDIEERFQIPEGAKTGEFVSREGVAEVPKTHGVFEEAYRDAVRRYRDLLDIGVPQEEARKVLPMGTKINIVVSANARAWMHILNVRTKANVQGETRRCAEAIFEELKGWMPYTFKKYDEDVLPLKLNP